MGREIVKAYLEAVICIGGKYREIESMPYYKMFTDWKSGKLSNGNKEFLINDFKSWRDEDEDEDEDEVEVDINEILATVFKGEIKDELGIIKILERAHFYGKNGVYFAPPIDTLVNSIRKEFGKSKRHAKSYINELARWIEACDDTIKRYEQLQYWKRKEQDPTLPQDPTPRDYQKNRGTFLYIACGEIGSKRLFFHYTIFKKELDTVCEDWGYGRPFGTKYSRLRTMGCDIINFSNPTNSTVTVKLPPELDTPEAITYLNRAVEAGFLTTDYKWIEMKHTRYQQTHLAFLFHEKLGYKNRWKPFEQLWNYKRFAQTYKAIQDNATIDNVDELESIFN